MLQAPGAGTGNGCRICLTGMLPPACPARAGVQLKSSDKDRNPSLFQHCLLPVACDTQRYSSGSEITEEKVSHV